MVWVAPSEALASLSPGAKTGLCNHYAQLSVTVAEPVNAHRQVALSSAALTCFIGSSKKLAWTLRA